jgi:aryl-alcohol dehydrogenase-like predicted oxidoreductase
MIGLGGYHIGKAKDEETAIRLVRMAIDHGMTFLDNCWDYHKGESERLMGKALQDGYRQRAFLMTKLDGQTRDAAQKQLEESLTRLRTDVIDLLQVHEVIRVTDPARVFGPDGAIEAYVAAQKAGKVRFIGFTGHKDPAIHLAMLKAAKDHGFVFDTVQMPLNVMDAHYKSFEREVLPALLQQDIGVLGMKSLGSGILLQSGAVTARECLEYALSLPTSVVITGCEREEILKQAIDVAMRFQPLTADARQALLARTAPHAQDGKFELFKTSTQFDGTVQNPHWLDSARL